MLLITPLMMNSHKTPSFIDRFANIFRDYILYILTYKIQGVVDT